jgi:hypothetical protein
MNKTSRILKQADRLEMAAKQRREAANDLAKWVAMGNDPTCPVALRASQLRCVRAGNAFALALEEGVAGERSRGFFNS